jgi:hypothetical protein
MVNKHIHIVPDHLNLADSEDDELQSTVHQALAEAFSTSNEGDHEISNAETSNTHPNKKGSKK